MKPPKGIFGCENTSFVAKVVKIGAIIGEISRFFDIYKMVAVRHLGFVGYGIGLPTKSTW